MPFFQVPEAAKSFAIVRVEKVKTRQALVQRAQHNDRTKDTPNADSQRIDLNKEYVNLAERPILELLDARTAEAGVGRPRANATLCVEVLLTGGPAAAVWQRARTADGQPGPAADMRGSQWEADIVAFAYQEWGKNLISLKLHQDELTPHFQAFVVPIVGPGGGRNGEADPQQLAGLLPLDAPARRSARDLFSPPRLARLQTDYAAVVEPHGFKRGINGSRAHHKTMAQMYGLLEKTTAETAPLVESGNSGQYKLAPPANPLQWSKWLRDTEADINARLTASDEKLRLAGQIAVAAAGGNEASARSRDWIEKEKQRKTDLGSEVVVLEFKLRSANDTVRELTQQVQEARTQEARLIEKHGRQQDTLARHALQGTLPTEVVTRAKTQLQAARATAREEVVKALTLPVEREAVVNERLTHRGYYWQEDDVSKLRYLVDNQTGARFREAYVRPGGEQAPSLAEQIAQAVRATQQAAEQARQAEIDRQLTNMRDQRRREHVAGEEWHLERFRDKRGHSGNAVVRVRVPAGNAPGMVNQLGRNTAEPDANPGTDGLVGINLCYNPQTSGASARISAALDQVRQLGGEIYEAADTRKTRERNTGTDHQQALNYSPDKAREQGLSL